MIIALFCKSYEGDLRRAQRLWESVQRYNRDQIPFYMSVPKADLSLFKKVFGEPNGLEWVIDEDIVCSNPRADLSDYEAWDGRLSQQVVKSEFWRYCDCENYLCIDSESEFIRDFFVSDFIGLDDVPYTVMHQSKELLQMSINKGIDRIQKDFHRDCEMLKEVFGRAGPDYDFGPTPVIWSAKVWSDLDEKHLKPAGMTIWDAIDQRPSELRWYGETLLYFKSIPLMPIEPLFRVYHYDWQWYTQRRIGETVDALDIEYMGVLRQSNWEYHLDYGAQAMRKSKLSQIIRSIKHYMARYR